MPEPNWREGCAKTTSPNSRPFALCTVNKRTAPAAAIFAPASSEPARESRSQKRTAEASPTPPSSRTPIKKLARRRRSITACAPRGRIRNSTASAGSPSTRDTNARGSVVAASADSAASRSKAANTAGWPALESPGSQLPPASLCAASSSSRSPNQTERSAPTTAVEREGSITAVRKLKASSTSRSSNSTPPPSSTKSMPAPLSASVYAAKLAFVRPRMATSPRPRNLGSVSHDAASVPLDSASFGSDRLPNRSARLLLESA